MPLATDGTLTTMVVGDHETTVAAVAPNFTVPCVLPKLRPAIVTLTPACATVGPMEPISGAAAPSIKLHAATVCAGNVKFVTGLLPPDPLLTVIEEPPSNPVRESAYVPAGSAVSRPVMLAEVVSFLLMATSTVLPKNLRS